MTTTVRGVSDHIERLAGEPIDDHLIGELPHQWPAAAVATLQRAADHLSQVLRTGQPRE